MAGEDAWKHPYYRERRANQQDACPNGWKHPYYRERS